QFRTQRNVAAVLTVNHGGESSNISHDALPLASSGPLIICGHRSRLSRWRLVASWLRSSPPLGLLAAQRHHRAGRMSDQLALLVAHVALGEADGPSALHHPRLGAQFGVPDRLEKVD